MISIVKDDNFEEQKANITRLLETGDERTVNVLKSAQFKLGQRISLNIEITDEFLSGNIFTMMYNPINIPGVENLGFKINSIGPTLEGGVVVDALHELILKIQNGDFNKRGEE